jgi:hypothetical protein
MCREMINKGSVPLKNATIMGKFMTLFAELIEFEMQEQWRYNVNKYAHNLYTMKELYAITGKKDEKQMSRRKSKQLRRAKQENQKILALYGYDANNRNPYNCSYDKSCKCDCQTKCVCSRQKGITNPSCKCVCVHYCKEPCVWLCEKVNWLGMDCSGGPYCLECGAIAWQQNLWYDDNNHIKITIFAMNEILTKPLHDLLGWNPKDEYAEDESSYDEKEQKESSQVLNEDPTFSDKICAIKEPGLQKHFIDEWDIDHYCNRTNLPPSMDKKKETSPSTTSPCSESWEKYDDWESVS